MSISSPFIDRRVGTTLLTAALALAGALAYSLLPVSPLPQVEFPTISVNANLPGADPATMASAVATPLERQFGRIAAVNEMSSTSSLGSTSITLQFDLSRDIDAAARDVQAAINAARGQLPANLPSNPTYRKVNPADAPIIILALTSDRFGKARMYDVASSVLTQSLSQVDGVGQVIVGGGALPAVRVEANPTALNRLGLGLDDVRTALASANANRPKGTLEGDGRAWEIATTDQLQQASEYRNLVVAWRDGAAVRLGDVADVQDSVEDVRTTGLLADKPAILMIVFRQPGANIIDTVDRVRALMPQLQGMVPAGIALDVVMDRTTTIRASVHDVQISLLISVSLVILVVFVFLRDARATFIPSIAVPVSLVATFAAMWLIGYSIDNLSLMALTIATGFVVDDAIVVIENIARHLEEGMSPRQAAEKGAREIGFTVISISISLIAVFIPLLLMGGIVGRLFREFAVTLSVAIVISMVVSLTTTPMLSAWLLRHRDDERRGRVARAGDAAFEWLLARYRSSLGFVLRHPVATLILLGATIAFNVWLYVVVPKGFFPQQDTGRMGGRVIADQASSPQAMGRLMRRYSQVVAADPAVEHVVAFAGGRGSAGNSGQMFVSLTPLAQRGIDVNGVIGRLRGKLAAIPGGSLFFQAYQDVRVGGRSSNAQYQYTLQGDDLDELAQWAPKVLARLHSVPGLADLSSDQQDRGLEQRLAIDRDTAARLGITASAFDSALYDAYGQRQVSTMYRDLNQYHVVLEAAPRFSDDAAALGDLRVRGAGGSLSPLLAVAQPRVGNTALQVTHQGQFPSTTLSFNLLPDTSLGQATGRIEAATREIGLPTTIQGSFSGTAQAFQESLTTQPALIAAAIVAVYIVLGMLYESLVHPITILSTLPSAGVGALLALILTHNQLDLIGLIGIILLIGIVKKNAILMIDFALEAERRDRLEPREAVFRACLLRFRPILMTTCAAMLGGLPLALGHGTGAELRRPLGVAIVGGLLVSQVLTLYTTPVVYLALDRLRLRMRRGASGEGLGASSTSRSSLGPAARG